eukprot:SAG11_NODE_9748_length_883_cov_1.383929_1_plen_89_part_10
MHCPQFFLAWQGATRGFIWDLICVPLTVVGGAAAFCAKARRGLRTLPPRATATPHGTHATATRRDRRRSRKKSRAHRRRRRCRRRRRRS